MATPTGGTIREFSRGMLARITGKLDAAVATGKTGTLAPIQARPEVMQSAFSPATQFFGAGMPLRPVAPPEIAGRTRDFPPYSNLSYVPRSEAGENAIDFKTLIRMASPAEGGLDLLRLAIETRKDQMSAQRWQIRGRQKDDDGGERAKRIERWLLRPDRVHTFQQWMRLVLEDHFVIDAPTIYYNSAGGRPLWEIIDGQTIKRLILSDDGRTPLPPLPAFQQILVGMPAVDYTLNEIGYYVYNPRPSKLYGMSRVEQVIVTILTALERAKTQLEYFTAGSVPDAFGELPENWSPEQIQQYSEWFNSYLAGQSDLRRRVHFVPKGFAYTPTKTEVLKDLFDEWLARIVCYAFSLSPQALVKETNRATAETSKQAAQEEGLEPTKIWFKGVMDDGLERIGAGDLEFQWQDEEIVDPKDKAIVIQMYYGGSTGSAKPIITLAEARAMGGLPPATPDQLAELQPPTPEPPPTIDATDATPQTDAEKVAVADFLKRKRAAGRAGGRSLPAARDERAAVG